MFSSVSVVWVLSCFLISPSLLWASPLTEPSDKMNKSGGSVRINSSEAHEFLPRSRRSADAKWSQRDPDFQSYYRYYSSIGHVEGLYELDKVRMLYQQTYGVDASTPQNVAALWFPPTTKPPPLPVTRPPESEVLYLCNPKDPLCKPRIVYVPTGAVVVPCDPRYHPSCKLSTSTEGPFGAIEPHTTALPNPMEFDCDPYWDPDCLIEKPQRAVKANHRPTSNLSNKSLLMNRAEEENEDVPASSAEDKEALEASYEPFDYSMDLYDPDGYVNSALGPE